MKVNSLMVLKLLGLTVQRLRPKALLVVCLFRFPEFVPLISIAKQFPEGGGGKIQGERKQGGSDESLSRMSNQE